MIEFYDLEFLGLKRKLPILPAPSGIKIAGFNSVGDMELLKIAGEDLSKQIKNSKLDFDIILTTELKGIPISQEVARLLQKDYVCLRKAQKCYMLNPVQVKSESITSGRTEYYVSETDFQKLQGKRVLFVDDVFSTGATFRNIIEFSKNSNIKIVGGAFILKEVLKTNLSSPLNFEFEGKSIFCSGALPLPE